MSEIIEEFQEIDLEERMKARASTPPEEKKRCPHCGGTTIVRKTNQSSGDPHREDGDYRCDRASCLRSFDEPVTGYRMAAAVRADSDGAEQ